MQDIRISTHGIARRKADDVNPAEMKKQLKKINDDYFASMANSSGWLTQSIGAYRAQRDRVRA